MKVGLPERVWLTRKEMQDAIGISPIILLGRWLRNSLYSTGKTPLEIAYIL